MDGAARAATSAVPHLHRMTLQPPRVSVATAAGGLLSADNCRSSSAAGTRRRCGCSGTVAPYVATFTFHVVATQSRHTRGCNVHGCSVLATRTNTALVQHARAPPLQHAVASDCCCAVCRCSAEGCARGRRRINRANRALKSTRMPCGTRRCGRRGSEPGMVPLFMGRCGL